MGVTVENPKVEREKDQHQGDEPGVEPDHAGLLRLSQREQGGGDEGGVHRPGSLRREDNQTPGRVARTA